MSVANELIEAIQSVIRDKDFDGRSSVVRLGKNGSYLFDWKSEDVSVKGEILQEDKIGILLQWLEIYKTVETEKDPGVYLQESAEAIVSRIRYLLEPLRIVEMDSTTNAVQIRSEKPLQDQGRIAYFEMILRSGKWFGHRNYFSMHRYSHSPDQENTRESVAFPLTRVQFEKLVTDLTEIL